MIKEIPNKAQTLIEYVNTLLKEALLAKRIASRIDTVMLARKWLAKNHLTMAAQANNARMDTKIRNIPEAFEILTRYGFPLFFDMNGNLYSWPQFD